MTAMSKELVSSAVEGFVGSFKLAAMIVIALFGVVSGFVNGETTPEREPQSRFHN